jgi:hypothetical protein
MELAARKDADRIEKLLTQIQKEIKTMGKPI